MKRMCVIGALCGAWLVSGGMAAPAAAAVLGPLAALQVGETDIGLILKLDPKKPGGAFLNQVFTTDAYRVAVTATLDPDASIQFGIDVTNFGADALPVVFRLGVGVNPFVEPTAASSGIDGTLTPGLREASGVRLGADVLPDVDGDGANEIFISGFNGIPFGIDLGPSSSSPGSYGPFLGGPIVGPTGPGFTFLDMTLAFTITGGGDRAELEGFTEVQAVPEPATIGLVGMGLIAVARRLRRRRDTV
jgi:hypothetical protein